MCTHCSHLCVHLLFTTPDGNSFTGNLAVDSAPKYHGRSLYFRGMANLKAAMLDLVSNYGLGQAEQVLLTGCSAGGLSTFLQAARVQSYLPAAATFKAAPGSGFFLLNANVNGEPVYPQEMQSIYGLANSSAGVVPQCESSLSLSEQWQCNFAQNAYPYLDFPCFPCNPSTILGSSRASLGQSLCQQVLNRMDAVLARLAGRIVFNIRTSAPTNK